MSTEPLHPGDRVREINSGTEWRVWGAQRGWALVYNLAGAVTVHPVAALELVEAALAPRAARLVRAGVAEVRIMADPLAADERWDVWVAFRNGGPALRLGGQASLAAAIGELNRWHEGSETRV